MSRQPLPIDPLLPQLVQSLSEHSSLVLQAPTGAGKTTRVPPALLAAEFAKAGEIVLLEPRRVAARAAAARIAAEHGSDVGGMIGYQVRFERRTSRDTRIVAMTEGVFIRRLQDDPFIERTAVVIFDEFHERSVLSDMALAMVRRVQAEVRPELRIVVMSATLTPEPIARFLGDCPVIESPGRLHPVEIDYLPHDLRGPVESAAAQATESVFESTTGDVLVFLPGVGEIRRTARELAPWAESRKVLVQQLYGDMPLDEQQAVLRPSERRRIVLATNVAETSVTIDGVTAVVDTGLARVLRLDPALGINKLGIERISRASADQRAGRAGRTAPGVCRRLWTAQQHRALVAETAPEIERVDLSGPVLELLCWGEEDVTQFPWFERPPTIALDQALDLLSRLSAVDTAGVSDLGRQMVRLPVHPRLARLLIAGASFGVAPRAALAAALLSERDPFLRSTGPTRPTLSHWSDSDLLDRVAALEQFDRNGERRSHVGTLDTHAARGVLRAAEQLLRLVSDAVSIDVAAQPELHGPDEALMRAVWAAFADRLARRREPNGRRALMVGGRGVRLADQSAVQRHELFVCVELEEIGQSDALVRIASAVDRTWIRADQLTTTVDIEFDPVRERVVAIRRTRWQDLVLDAVPVALPMDGAVAELLAREAAARLDVLSLLDEAAREFLTRSNCLAAWMPELELPTLDAKWLAELLPTLCAGRQSFADLRSAPFVPLIKSQLSPPQLQAVERHAPARIEVPSGSQIALQYEAGKPPILAVRIQELFGLAETPRIAAGRVPVLLHLLGPNYRPQQITADLASFWRNTYAEVRKELRRRYPKHAWPDDPLTAQAEHRPKRK